MRLKFKKSSEKKMRDLSWLRKMKIVGLRLNIEKRRKKKIGRLKFRREQE
jgi:hypothetical protein